MFDSYTLGQRTTEYVPYEKTITENRAPTDESIKIYDEIVNRAYKSILNSIKVEGNIFNCKAILYQPCEFGQEKIVCSYHADLNGFPLEGKLEYDFFEFRIQRKTEEEVLQDIFKKLSEHVAAEILKVAFKDKGFDYRNVFRRFV